MGHDHRRCGSCQGGGHGRDPSHHDHHHGEVPRTAGPSLTARERLILRLEHQIRHNSEHAAGYETMAAEAEALGCAAAASCLRTAAQNAALQDENLRQALAALKA